MKKFRTIFMTIIAMMAMTVAVFAADKIEWEDKNYGFYNVRSVSIGDLKLTDSREFSSDLLHKILQEDFVKNAAHTKDVNVIEGNGGDVYVKVELLQWHDDFYIQPEYTTWEKKEYTRERKHKDGSRYTEKYYVTVPVVHPPRRVDTSTVRIRFDVYDADTGKLIMSRDEKRVREDKQAQRGMFGRIVKSFFDDFGKKVKKSK